MQVEDAAAPRALVERVDVLGDDGLRVTAALQAGQGAMDGAWLRVRDARPSRARSVPNTAGGQRRWR